MRFMGRGAETWMFVTLVMMVLDISFHKFKVQGMTPQYGYQITPYTTQSPNIQLDLVFVIDGSSSICGKEPGNALESTYTTCTNYQFLVMFLVRLLNDLPIGPNAVHIGSVFEYGFGSDYFDLGRYSSKDDMIEYLVHLSYQRGIRSMKNAFNTMRTSIFNNTGDRPYIPNVAIFITDGRPTENFEELLREIDSVISDGIILYAVGVTNNTDLGFMQAICSPPHQLNNNFYMVNSYTTLSTILPNLVYSIKSNSQN